MKFGNRFVKFIELRTEDEPLYLYEIYKQDPNDKFSHEVPTTIEFFTQEEGIRNYLSLEFLNRRCKYATQNYTMQGEFIEDYTRELSPYEFLEKVWPYLKNKETFERKINEVKNSMEFKANLTNYRMVKKQLTEMPKEKQDEVAKIILKRYMKES